MQQTTLKQTAAKISCQRVGRHARQHYKTPKAAPSRRRRRPPLPPQTDTPSSNWGNKAVHKLPTCAAAGLNRCQHWRVLDDGSSYSSSGSRVSAASCRRRYRHLCPADRRGGGRRGKDTDSTTQPHVVSRACLPLDAIYIANEPRVWINVPLTSSSTECVRALAHGSGGGAQTTEPLGVFTSTNQLTANATSIDILLWEPQHSQKPST